jgi:hypothetical protein
LQIKSAKKNMSEVRSNTFSMLGEDEHQSSIDSPTVAASSEVRTESVSSPQKPGDGGNDDSNWTVQQNTRSRRLAPAWTLSRHDLGAENLSRSKSSGSDPPASAPEKPANSGNLAHSTSQPHQVTKKKGI